MLQLLPQLMWLIAIGAPRQNPSSKPEQPAQKDESKVDKVQATG